MPQAVNGDLDASGKLSLAVGDWVVDLSSGNCEEYTEVVRLCSENVQITLRKENDSVIQTITLPSLYLNTEATLYYGSIDADYERDGHSLLISDVNGDGYEDFLAWTGREAAYGGPSYAIYLYDPQSKKFTHSSAFSELTEGYNGLFSVEQGNIKAASSEGCCLHVLDTYEVRAGQPVLVERVMEDTNLPDAPKRTVERLINGQLQEMPEP